MSNDLNLFNDSFKSFFLGVIAIAFNSDTFVFYLYLFCSMFPYIKWEMKIEFLNSNLQKKLYISWVYFYCRINTSFVQCFCNIEIGLQFFWIQLNFLLEMALFSNARNDCIANLYVSRKEGFVDSNPQIELIDSNQIWIHFSKIDS